MNSASEHLTTNTYQIPLYPEESNGDEQKFGICLSGGGSRALTCALGQLSALRGLQDPRDRQKTLLDRVDYLSSVSGGSWASVLYKFLPEEIDGQPVDDDEFFIVPCNPQDLCKKDKNDNVSGNVSYMNRFCLGSAPQQFHPVGIAKFLYKLYEWGFFKDSEKWRWFWIAAVGEIILRPFGLYDAAYNHNEDDVEPNRFFSLSENHVATHITPDNPSLGADQFYLCRSDRPALFVNFNLMPDDTQLVPVQIPVQATPVETGMRGQSPDDTLVGGGGVESFGFSSHLLGGRNMAEVGIERRYSLCDIAGCSSAFFAAYLLFYMNKEIDKIFEEVENHLDEFLPKWVAKRVVAKIESHIEPFLNAKASELIPKYNYWPLSRLQEGESANATYGFSDGGDFENTGLLGMLARTDATKIIAFVNGNTPLSKDAQTGEVIVNSQIPVLFGYKGDPVCGKYVSYGGMKPDEPFSYVQIFKDDVGEKSAFSILCEGLYNASCGGRDKEADLGTFTASFTQTLTTIENPVAHIKGGRQVTVLWVYNNRVNTWQDAITDQDIQKDLREGQAAQNRNGTPKSGGKNEGSVENFPYYATGSQIHIDEEGVNLLAQLSAWNVQQIRGDIENLFHGPVA